MKKVMYAIFFRSTGLIKFEGQKTITANWYITKCLSQIPQNVNVRGLVFHYDITSSDTRIDNEIS